MSNCAVQHGSLGGSLIGLLLALAGVGCGDNLTHAPDRPGYGKDAAPLSCLPNLDGVIEARELAPALDVPVSYLISPAGKERTVDLVGAVSDGHRTWTLATDYADDARISVQASALAGHWYADSFATGQFVTPFDAAASLEAVYRQDDQALWLLGIASSRPAPPEGKTLLIYDAPIAVFRFPLKVGAAWTATSTISNGTVRGLPYAGRDTYQVDDDAVGTLVLHDLTFQQVHRVHTLVTVTPSAGAAVARRQVSLVGECFGELVRAVSRDGEPVADFTVTTELRRLGQ